MHFSFTKDVVLWIFVLFINVNNFMNQVAEVGNMPITNIYETPNPLLSSSATKMAVVFRFSKLKFTVHGVVLYSFKVDTCILIVCIHHFTVYKVNTCILPLKCTTVSNKVDLAY